MLFPPISRWRIVRTGAISSSLLTRFANGPVENLSLNIVFFQQVSVEFNNYAFFTRQNLQAYIPALLSMRIRVSSNYTVSLK